MQDRDHESHSQGHLPRFGSKQFATILLNLTRFVFEQYAQRPMRTAYSSLLAMAILSVGCTSYTMIQPSEVPKLSNSFVANVGNNTIAVRVVHVKQPDGTVAEVKGEFSLRITTRDGQATTFEHPVMASQEGNVLTLAGGNQAEVRYDLSSITKAEVGQPDRTAYVVALSSLILLPIGAIVLTS